MKQENSDKRLLQIYMYGFNDCFDNEDNSKLYKDLELKAYKLGWDYSIIGDDVMSADYKSNEEILKMIKE